MAKKRIGVVSVDSGQILICDPCHIDGEWKWEEFGGDVEHNFSYNACCEQTTKPPYFGQLSYAHGHDGVGVVSVGGPGDGEYPVYAYIDGNGTIERIVIEFNEEKEAT